MSRIGKLPVALPDKVKLTVEDRTVSVKGPKGELSEKMPLGISLEHDDKQIAVIRDNDSNPSRAAQGLARALLANMVEGVSKGFTRGLVINGVGYRAEQKGPNWLMFTLGYSHPILFELPEGMGVEIDAKAKEPKLTLTHINKQVLGSVCAQIRSLRPPEPYKGKGIRYADETIRRKEGKAGGK